MANTPFFWKLIHKSYLRAPVGNEEVYQEKLRLTREHLQSDWELLEIGCGSGNTALSHAPYVAHVTAADFCDEMMQHGRTRASNEGVDNIDFITSNLDDLNENTPFDAVLMLSVIHLIPDWKSAIAKAARLTRTGGIFVSSTVTIKDKSTLMKIVGHVVNALPILPSLHIISRQELVDEMRANGLVIDVNYQPDGADSCFLIARKPAV